VTGDIDGLHGDNVNSNGSTTGHEGLPNAFKPARPSYLIFPLVRPERLASCPGATALSNSVVFF
jgi:hypothetical protein